MLDIRDIIRRLQLQTSGIGASPATCRSVAGPVLQYAQWAAAQGCSPGPLPDQAALQAV